MKDYPTGSSETSESISGASRRVAEASLLERYWEHEEAGGSLRSFAAKAGVAPSTLVYKVQRAETPRGGSRWRRFVETAEGVGRLHRIVVAALYVIVLRSGGGIRMVQEFLELAGLDDVVASSFGSLQRAQRDLEEAIVAFGDTQKAVLSAQMPSKVLTLAEDETFQGGRPCLVAMDVVSNFLLVEAFADDRKRATWTERVEAATSSMPVQIAQCVTDGARALKSHVELDLCAHQSPDLFHIQQDVRRATSRGLKARAERCDVLAQAASDAVEQAQKAAEEALAGPSRPGRCKNFEKRIEDAYEARDAARRCADQAAWDRAVASDAAAEITFAYHLFDPTTGERVAPEALREALERAFKSLHEASQRAALPHRAKVLLAKAHTLVDSLVATLAFARSRVALQLEQLDMEPTLRADVERYLVAACYLERVATQATSAAARDRVLERAKELRKAFDVEHPDWVKLEPEHKAHVERVSQRAADSFQRSSSCVEGRNGVLALGRHCFHELSTRRLAALTTVHNFAIRRHDGTTAAERFFEMKHDGLFEHLLRTLPPPARPRRGRRPSQANVTAQ